tara:strand:+ start:920 stop:1096 length:177 start_codon:yes stop_codon:yes gene_type:complete
MLSPLSIAAGSCRLLARASIVVTRLALLKVEETFRVEQRGRESKYHDAIHDDDDDMTV